MRKLMKRLLAILIILCIFGYIVLEGFGFFDLMVHGGEYMVYVLPGLLGVLIIIILLFLMIS